MGKNLQSLTCFMCYLVRHCTINTVLFPGLPNFIFLQAVIILWNRTEQFRHIISRSRSGSDTCSCPSLTLCRTLRVGKMSVQVFRTSTSPLPISEIIGVLRAPPEEKLSTLPLCKPKAGELYVYRSVNSPVVKGLLHYM